MTRIFNLCLTYGLLEGGGKIHKYVQLHTASDLNRPGLKQLIKVARAAWQQRNG
jgi:hypothetical protein